MVFIVRWAISRQTMDNENAWTEGRETSRQNEIEVESPTRGVKGKWFEKVVMAIISFQTLVF